VSPQRSEDAARNLRSIWKGPTGGWTWPFDATYTEWAIGLLTIPLWFLLLWLVAPVGVLVFICAWWAGRWLANGFSLDQLARITFSRRSAARQRGRWLGVGLVVAFALLLDPNPGSWIFPSPFWLAGPLAVIVSWRVVKAVRPYIDANRPVSFWVRSLPDFWGQIRPLRDPLAVEMPSLPIADDAVDQALLDYTMRTLAVDPQEVHVIQYRQRTPVVEAMLFDSTNHDDRTSINVISWLRGRGVHVQINGVTERHVENPDGTRHAIVDRAFVVAGGVPLLDNTVVVLSPDRAVTCVQRRDFGEGFEAVLTVAEQAAQIASGRA
jgi:hypothetical protein